MPETQWLAAQSQKTLARIWPRIEQHFTADAVNCPDDWQAFERRVSLHFPRLFARLYTLYGSQYDFFFHLEHLLERLGERFFRVDPSRSRAAGGAGLGLALSREIVEAHGGRLLFSPSPLGGLRVTLTLPRTQ